MLSLFKKKSPNPILVDVHSHLIPGIDDGVKSTGQALQILKELEELGVQKVVTTPHIAHEFYPNTPEIIENGLEKLQSEVKKAKIDIKIEAAAEYYVDNYLLEEIKTGKRLLTFGDDYLLFETPFINKPPFFKEVVFELKARGIKPVLAHPERYQYLLEDFNDLFRIRELEVLFQVTASSFIGYYSKDTMKLVDWIMKNNLVDFLGSDIHHSRHLEAYKTFRVSKKYTKLTQNTLLNNTLL